MQAPESHAMGWFLGLALTGCSRIAHPLCIEGESQSDSAGHPVRSTKRMNESYLTLPDAPTGSTSYVAIHSTYVLLLIDRTGPGEETVDGLPAGAQAVLCCFHPTSIPASWFPH